MLLIIVLSTGCTNLSEISNNPDNPNNPNDPNNPSAPDTPSTPKRASQPWVYFIGNSITYVADIPGRFHKLVTQNGGYPDGYSGYAQHTPGGAPLVGRVSSNGGDSRTIMDILSKKPRYIVLQEQSLGISSNRTCNTIPKYSAIARASNSELIIYQTWHLGSYGIQYPPRTQKNNRTEFLKLAQDFQLAMAPNGQIWEQLDNGSFLLLGDYVHQNALGASLYAASFFYLLRPDVSQISGLIAETGYNLSSTDDNRYNQVVFDTVRNSDYNTTLRGVVSNENTYNGLINCHGIRRDSEKVIIDDEGNSLEEPIVLTDGTTNFDVDVPSFDIDIYLLPRNLTGKNITITMINQRVYNHKEHDNVSADNTIFLGYANGQTVNHTLAFISATERSFTFTVPTEKVYLGFIGGGIVVQLSRSVAEGQFKVTITEN